MLIYSKNVYYILREKLKVFLCVLFLFLGSRYYLNIDLCAYGNSRSTRDPTTGQRRVYGPRVYAVNGDCSFAYKYIEAPSIWKRMLSVNRTQYAIVYQTLKIV